MTEQTILQLALTIAIIGITTVFTRALPFILFPTDARTPEIVKYLGTALPYASIAMLVIYCFKNTDFLGHSHGLPEIIAGVFVIVIHKWRHNLLLSIGGGTILYMILVQAIFR